MATMIVAVLSDLHLGARNRLDRFDRGVGRGAPRSAPEQKASARRVAAPDPESELLDLLDELERIADLIVLLGDVFETLRGRLPGSEQQELKTALAAYPRISRRILDSRRYRLLQGNHDVIAGSVLGAPEFLELRHGSTRLLFFHGHQTSWLERGRAPLSRAGVWLGGWAERAGFRVTAAMDRWRQPAELYLRSMDYDGKVAQLGRDRGAEVVVTGHTHVAKRAEIHGQLILNSGTCVAGRREYLILDVGRSDYQVFQRLPGSSHSTAVEAERDDDDLQQEMP